MALVFGHTRQIDFLFVQPIQRMDGFRERIMTSAFTAVRTGGPSDDKVDFVVAGAQKAGTTALRRFLGQHPEIGLVRNSSETHYFDKYSEEAARGEYSGYHAMYSDVARALCTGDVTPAYLYQHDCFEQIRGYNPDMKIVVLLRDPVDRAYSQWVMEHGRGLEHRGFVMALLHELFHWIFWGQHPVYSYVQRGFYGSQIERLFKFFPRDQCLILLNSDLRENHNDVLRRVFEFLGVKMIEPPLSEVVHSRKYPPMPKMFRLLLRLIYHRDARYLERLIGGRRPRW